MKDLVKYARTPVGAMLTLTSIFLVAFLGTLPWPVPWYLRLVLLLVMLFCAWDARGQVRAYLHAHPGSELLSEDSYIMEQQLKFLRDYGTQQHPLLRKEATERVPQGNPAPGLPPPPRAPELPSGTGEG